jgi:hypothetical protein
MATPWAPSVEEYAEMKKEVRELLNKYKNATWEGTNESKLKEFLGMIREEAALNHNIMILDIIDREEFAEACHYYNENIKKRVEDEKDKLWRKLVVDFYNSHIDGSCEALRAAFVKDFLEDFPEQDDDVYYGL